MPWSKGCPAALGACDDLEKMISAIKVTTYGNALRINPGIFANAGTTCDTFASVLAKPKKNVAPSIPRGFH